jgi:hypothetical protein
LIEPDPEFGAVDQAGDCPKKRGTNDCAKKQRVHPPELKAKVGLEALSEMKIINQIAKNFGVYTR